MQPVLDWCAAQPCQNDIHYPGAESNKHAPCCHGPPHLQTPAEEDRAAPYRPKAALLYTGSNSSAAQQLSEGLLPDPAVTASTLLSAQRYLDAFRADLGPGVAAVPGVWVLAC